MSDSSLGGKRARLFDILDSVALAIPRGRRGPVVRWFDEWTDEVADACAALPDPWPWNLESYRLLCTEPVDVTRRIAVVEDADGPMAVIGMWRGDSLRWTSVAESFLPGDPFPVRDGCVGTAVRALGLEFEMAVWNGRMTPESVGADHATRSPSHRALASEIREGWSKKHRRTIKQAQDRCADFRLEVNGPDAADWVARRLYEKWGFPTEFLELYLSLNRQLTERGELQVVRLFDEDRPIGGQVSIVMDGTLYMIEVFREPGYEWHGLGNRLIELTVDCGIERGGVEWMDLESGHGHYKSKWAREGGHVDEYVFDAWHLKPVRWVLGRLDGRHADENGA